MGVVYWALTRLLPGTHRFFGVLRLWISLLFCYAFGTVGMFRQIHTDDFQQAIRMVTDAAAKISAAIGYRG